jgi:hypothetical protein
MKKHFRQLAIAFGLAFSLGLVSCQQDNLVTPDAPAMSAGSLREAGLPTIPKNYQLIKHGTAALSYFDDGRLKKVTYSNSVRGKAGVYASYAYKGQSIIVTVYSGNSMVQIITYLLDANGRCYESKQLDYIPYGTNATLEQETSFLYAYTPKGQLMTRTDKKYAFEKTAFTYDGAGDLSKITNYGYFNGLPSATPVSEYTLSYDRPGGDPILADLSPINCETANLSDPYLKIFGKESKHLVSLIKEKSELGGKYLNYTLNAAGYVTSRQTYNVSGAALIETKQYDYLVTDLVMHL